MYSLHPNWKKVFKRAHSVRWMIAAIVFTFFEGGIGIYTAFAGAPPFGIPMGAFAGLSGACSALALYTRFMAQKGYDDA